MSTLHYSFKKSSRTNIIYQIEKEIQNRKGRKKGIEIFFLCPLPEHDDHHPSCRWNPEKRLWYCDVCGVGGGWKSLAVHLGIIKGDGYV